MRFRGELNENGDEEKRNARNCRSTRRVPRVSRDGRQNYIGLEGTRSSDAPERAPQRTRTA